MSDWYTAAERVITVIAQLDPSDFEYGATPGKVDADGPLMTVGGPAVTDALTAVPDEIRRTVFMELDERYGQFYVVDAAQKRIETDDWHWKLRRTRNSFGPLFEALAEGPGWRQAIEANEAARRNDEETG